MEHPCIYVVLTVQVFSTKHFNISKVTTPLEAQVRGDVKIPTCKPHTNHKKPSVSSHTLAPTTICDLSHSVCRSPLTDLSHRSSVTYVCHPLWFVCGHRKGILMSPLREPSLVPFTRKMVLLSGVMRGEGTLIYLTYNSSCS